MRTYSKPVVEIENFNLDAQFAEGGCATNVNVSQFIDNATAVMGMWTNTGSIEEGSNPWIQTGDQLLSIIGDSTGDAAIQLLAEYIGRVDTGSLHGDNANSGGCYFTLSNASGKTFS